MFVKQLSVFIENRKGRLEQVAGVLKENDVNILSLSLADTNEYGLLRMIVSDPKKAREILKEEGFSAMLTDVLAIKLENRAGRLQTMLKILSDADLNVEYMYVLDSGTENGSMVVKVTDADKALGVIKAGGLEVFDAKTAYHIHE